MSDLKTLKCEACRVGAPQVTQEEVLRFSPLVPEWKIVEENGIKKLKRKFIFENFAQGLSFVNKIAAVAESEGHHPALCLEYTHVIVSCWTHKIKGLHMNDYIMAAKIDAIR